MMYRQNQTILYAFCSGRLHGKKFSVFVLSITLIKEWLHPFFRCFFKKKRVYFCCFFHCKPEIVVIKKPCRFYCKCNSNISIINRQHIISVTFFSSRRKIGRACKYYGV